MASQFMAEDYGLETADLHSCFVVACALYWHCVDYHEGQSSERYRISCVLDYQPGMCESGPEEDTTEETIYQDLADESLSVEDVYAWFERNYALAKDKED
jgi:hypothetical protein